jgi:hypothetical protein
MKSFGACEQNQDTKGLTGDIDYRKIANGRASAFRAIRGSGGADSSLEASVSAWWLESGGED